MSDNRPTAPQYVTLTTPGGYRMHATITLDWEQEPPCTGSPS